MSLLNIIALAFCVDYFKFLRSWNDICREFCFVTITFNYLDCKSFHDNMREQSSLTYGDIYFNLVATYISTLWRHILKPYGDICDQVPHHVFPKLENSDIEYQETFEFV